VSPVRRWLFAWAAGWLLTLSGAHAHLIVSQRGTLNIVGNGAYMVLSLPVSAFAGIDDSGDGRLSLDELRTHAGSIEAQVHGGVQLVSSEGVHMLEGVMLNTAPPDNAPAAPAEQLVVMGRFPLDPQVTHLTFTLGLFGKGSGEQVEQIAVTRGSETQLMTLTPQLNQGDVLPSAWTVFFDQAVNGATHVLTGADHLLFLLVVLAAGWGFRKIVLALTCFTVGHAITLVACAWFGLAVPPTLVEPAIAATVVGVALFDRWCYRRQVNFPAKVRLSLIFGCALIHGLGLARAFSDLGLDFENKLVSLAGFNTGIELGQLTVVLFAAVVMKLIHSLRGVSGVAMATRLASYAAVLMGSFWFLERVAYTA
jgi:HupE / UreJ protein